MSEQQHRPCIVEGCDRMQYARQPECEAHYRRRRRTGDVHRDLPIGATRGPQPCSVTGCTLIATERGWCHGHYLRWIRLGELQEERPLSRQVNFACSVDECDRPAENRGLCKPHASRKRKFGHALSDKPIRVVPGTGYLSHGYRHVPIPADLRYFTDGQTPYPEHRLVMAQLLGRPLTSDESVHHVNGDRTDNRVDGPLVGYRSGNLELWSRWQPSGQRVCDKVEYAIEILERYLPAALAEQLPLNLPMTE